MIVVKVGSVELNLNKNEAKEVQHIADEVLLCDAIDGNFEVAQRSADIWIRSAPDQKAQERRKAAVRALGLSDVVKFL